MCSRNRLGAPDRSAISSMRKASASPAFSSASTIERLERVFGLVGDHLPNVAPESATNKVDIIRIAAESEPQPINTINMIDIK